MTITINDQTIEVHDEKEARKAFNTAMRDAKRQEAIAQKAEQDRQSLRDIAYTYALANVGRLASVAWDRCNKRFSILSLTSVW